MKLNKMIKDLFFHTDQNSYIPQVQEVIKANGQPVEDKRDVEDPVGKFSGPRHIETIYKSGYQRKRNVNFYCSEYDLPTIANAVQQDGILRRSVTLFVEQILKNSFEFKSKQDTYLRHVKRRIREIENLTGVSFHEFVSQVANQLVTYGNCYVIKVREKDVSKFGRTYTLYGKEHNPIVGLFVADATTMEIGLNEKGHILNYQQVVRGELRIWDERDVIHLAYNKIPGTLTGMSSILPVLDDVRALRKLEEEIEILGFQYSIPLYLYKVGTKDIPPAPGEVDSVSSTVSNMPAYGMLVVPGHHTIEVPSNANTPVDVLSFVEHFKKRIFAGLGVSPVAMGESSSSNRNTSEVLDNSMQTITKSYQQIIKHKLELELIRELLLDGGYSNSEDNVEFSFPEIDIENQIKKETHIIALWQNNLITRTEARVMMDYDANAEESDLFLEKVDMPKLELQFSTQVEVADIGAKAAAKSAAASAARTTSSSKKNAKSTSSKVRPSNQHGTSTGRPKYVKNDVQLNLFDGLSIFNQDEFIKNLTSECDIAFKDELDYTITDICKYYHIDKPSLNDKLVTDYLDKVHLIIEDKITLATKNLDNDLRFENISKITKDFLIKQSDKIRNLAKILVYKSLGYKTILVTSDDCDNHTNINLEISKISYTDIPPFSYNCKCEVEEESFNEFI
jgi:hypothetical protein